MSFLHHEPCPACGSRDNLARYSDGAGYCFGCGRYERPTHAPAERTGFTPKYYDGALAPLSAELTQRLQARYWLQPTTLSTWDVRQVVDREAITLPIFAPGALRVRGMQIRYLDGTKPKCLTYKMLDEPLLAWYTNTSGRQQLVIVEDIFSAMRLWQRGIAAVALLGTNLAADRMYEIRQHALGMDLYIALDRDMADKTIGYARRYSLRPVLLEDDIKDISDEEIESKFARRRIGD